MYFYCNEIATYHFHLQLDPNIDQMFLEASRKMKKSRWWKFTCTIGSKLPLVTKPSIFYTFKNFHNQLILWNYFPTPTPFFKK